MILFWVLKRRMAVHGMIVAIEKCKILLLVTTDQILKKDNVLGDLAHDSLEYFRQTKEYKEIE